MSSMSKRVARAPRLASITDLDRGIVELLEQRARLVLDQAAHGENGKKNGDLWQDGQRGLAIRRRDGASSLLPACDFDAETVRGLINGNGLLAAGSIVGVLRHIAGACRSLVGAPRIAFSGPLYGLAHLAAIGRFGHGIEFVPVGNLGAVFEEVERGQSDIGLAPLDNSAEGRLAETLGLLRNSPIRICEQIELPVHRALLGKCPRTDVREIYGTPEALSACRNWLAKHLPAARMVEVTSAASAGQLAGEKAGAAAVAAVEAGPPFGLGILADNIEDHGPQIVRWAVIGRRPPSGAGRRRTAVLLELNHRPGALADVLTDFKREKINLTRVESLPAAEADRRCAVFLELDGSQSSAACRRAIAALKKKSLRLDVLGSYQSATGHPKKSRRVGHSERSLG
jgi:chorismate mutase/prephenate dehydratase